MDKRYSRERVKGFLHAEGTKMVNGRGEQVILRGWGMGNWDNPEAFMLGIQSGFGGMKPGEYSPMGRMDRGRSMEHILRETCGTEYTESFWDRWHRAYLSEEDIKLLAERGYNSVRLPIRAGTFLKEEPGVQFNETSFQMLDDVLDWCEKYSVYAIIDVHAASAGQSCIPCDDGVDNCPHFYTDEDGMERLHLLMEEFARRYRDRTIVGGYDCVNEPLSVTPTVERYTPVLQEFYQEMIRRFRQLDKNHMFLLNGVQVSSLVHIFDRDFDPQCHNWGISLHCYEMVSPEPVSVSDVLNKCRELQVPLWMGETGGRNEHAWQTTMYEILREHDAGYNLWCWKTCVGAGCASVLNFTVPEEWHLIVDYATKGGPKPAFEHAQRIWDEYLEAVKAENCAENTQYHPYLLRAGDFEIPAIGYNDLPADSRNGTLELPSGTNYRLSDRLEIVYEKGFHPPVGFPGMGAQGIHLRDHMHLRLHAGEFVTYHVEEDGPCRVSVTYCAKAPAAIRLTADGTVVFEGTLPPAAETPAKPEEKNPLFPTEPAAAKLSEKPLGETNGRHEWKLEVLSGEADFGSVIIRKK